MTAIDLMIIAVTAYAIWRFRLISRSGRPSELRIAPWLVASGLLLVCLFYSVDLLSMYVLPAITSAQEAMAFMGALHRNFSWLIAMFAMIAISIGFVELLSELQKRARDLERAAEEIRKVNEELEQRVIERTRDLEAVNKELEAFAYSASHDLRAPLRHTAGYAELLQKNAFSMLDEKSRRYTLMILESAKRMGTLIDDLLAFSRVGRAEIQKTNVSLEQVVREALSEVRQETDGRNIAWMISALPSVYGDRSMLRLVFVNLISNAVKFTRARPQAEIEIGCGDGKQDEVVVFIRDNGVGFDMKYVNKLFGVFQRLHRTEEFEGTGIGLATVQRIIHRHGGRVWAEAVVSQGASFYVSLPKS